MRKQLVLKEAFLFLLEFFYYIPAPVYYIIYLHQYVIFFQFFFFPLHTCTSRVIAHRLRHAKKVCYYFYLHTCTSMLFFPRFFFPLHTCTSRVIAHRLRHAIFPNNNVPSESVRLRESKKKNLKDSIQK